MKHTLPLSPAPYWTYLMSPLTNFQRRLYKLLCLNSGVTDLNLTQLNWLPITPLKTKFHLGTPPCQIIDDCKFQASRGAVLTFYPKLTENYLTDSHVLFTRCRCMPLLMHALHGDMAFHFTKSEHRVKASDVAKESMVKWPCKFLCLKLWGRWTKSYENFTQCTEMIAD